MRYWVLPLALAMVYAGISEAEIEKHREGTGEYSIEADVVDLEEGWVVLRTSDGKLIELPAKELSRADQRWVQTRVSGKIGVPKRSRTSGGDGGWFRLPG